MTGELMPYAEYPDEDILHLVFGVEPDWPLATITEIRQLLTSYKQLLVTLDNDHILEFYAVSGRLAKEHGEAGNREREENIAQTQYALEELFQVVPYIDLSRARDLFQRALSGEVFPEDAPPEDKQEAWQAATAAAEGLPHLSHVLGVETMNLWQTAFEHEEKKVRNTAVDVARYTISHEQLQAPEELKIFLTDLIAEEDMPPEII